ncbi:LacI family DNA-binding transcriptional regulator [Serinibacter salmoneus]|uniref:LacI family transcriptional regulator n=1 Tax=Serinibacter salmoneus TaxID=556530 RepID=A0A2A9D5Z7_9MICO|nr:LacI family DNA-binding transcriptional regulator [Serinibacter salmoneus]PFG21269.1 LacI family transcriptional regulator [Serinibacter salmoneus]
MPDASDAQPRRVTLADVAREAGCSVPAASKALAGKPHVAADTRERVLHAAAQLGFRRRPVRHPQRENMIVAAFDGFGSVYSGELFSGALATATESGVEVLTQLLRRGKGVDAVVLDRLLATEARGALIVTSTIEPEFLRAAREADFPIVTVDSKSRVDDRVVSIGATNWAGGAMATTHLLDLGHRRIGYIGVDHDSDFGLERFAGYRSALERAGVPFDERLTYPGDTEYETGFAIGRSLARDSTPPTGVVCICDAVALGVIEGARRGGLRTPDDLSVVGFDDIPPAKWMSPPLTTVRQPMRRMGGVAVRTLLRMIEGREPDSHHVQLATSLVERGTTSPPAALREQDTESAD